MTKQEYDALLEHERERLEQLGIPASDLETLWFCLVDTFGTDLCFIPEAHVRPILLHALIEIAKCRFSDRDCSPTAN
jgi:hypothetical protein